jgi:Cu+-exporting ATPase
MKRTLQALAAFTIALGITTMPAASQTSDKKERQSAAAEKGKVKDPVCGMMIDPKTAAAKAEYKDKTYYFCSREEKEKFEKSPETYVKQDKRARKKTN